MWRSFRIPPRVVTILTLVVGTGALFIVVEKPFTWGSSMAALEELSRDYHSISYCDHHRLQEIDLYLPYLSPGEDNMSSSSPLIVYVHGGGWSEGDKRNTIANYYGSQFVSMGFAFASINYRLAPSFRYPVQNNDVACAIATLANRAEEYEIDRSRVMLFGDSAGGLLVNMYALTTKRPPVTIRGIIDFYGTTDLVYQLTRKQHNNRNASNYLGGENLGLARRASPIYQPIPSTMPPLLFLHGDEDTVVTRQQAYDFFKRVRAIQPSSQFITVRRAGHGFTRTSTPTETEIRDIISEFAERQLRPVQ